MLLWLYVGYLLLALTLRVDSADEHPARVHIHYLDAPGETLPVADSCVTSLTCVCSAIGVERDGIQVQDMEGDLVHISHDSVWEKMLGNSSTGIDVDVVVSLSMEELLRKEEDRVLAYLKKEEEVTVNVLVEERIPRFSPPEQYARKVNLDVASCRSGASRTLVGFVVDTTGYKYQLQALHLVRSIFAFGGSLAESTLLAVVIGCLASEIEEEFSQFGVKVKYVSPMNETLSKATPHCNKLRFFLTDEARDVEAYDKVIYLDTDILVLDDPMKYFERGDSSVLFRTGTTLWSDAVFRFKIWEELCDLCGASTQLNVTVGWPNTGVIIMPTWRVPLLAFEWMHFVDYLSLNIPEEDQYFLDTLAFIFALEAMARVHDGGRVQQAAWRLPWQLNAQLNWPKYDMIRNGWVEHPSAVYPVLLLQYAQESIRFDNKGRPDLYDSGVVTAFPFLAKVNTKLNTDPFI